MIFDELVVIDEEKYILYIFQTLLTNLI